MRIRHCLIPALLALALIPGAPQAAEREPVNRLSPPAASERPARTERTHRLIVRYADGTRGIAGTVEASGVDAATHARQQAQQLGAQMGESLSFIRHAGGQSQVLALPDPRDMADMETLTKRLAALPEVRYAEPDRPRYIMSVDDPLFQQQWHYLNPDQLHSDDLTRESSANVEAAWTITTGSSDIVVAVLDTGLRPHPDIVGDELEDGVETGGVRNLPGFDMVSDARLNSDERDLRTANPTDPGDWITAGEHAGTEADGFFEGCGGQYLDGSKDSSWHGTHVAGTIGAITNNELGVAGIDHEAMILPVRVLGKCFGWTSDIMDGVRWAAGLSTQDPTFAVPDNPNPAHVINLSLGGGGSCSTFEQEAIDAARAEGAIIIAAAGNESQNAGNVSPASCDGVITVAALARDGSRAFYSNFGSVVDIAAPGGEDDWPPGVSFRGMILSTSNTGTQDPIDDGYFWQAGTSMATPHVAGAVSLMLSLAPDLTQNQVMAILAHSARPFPQTDYSTYDCTSHQCGVGMLDVAAAVQFIDNGILTLGDIADQSLRVGNNLILDVPVIHAGDFDLTYTLDPNQDLQGNITLNGTTFEWHETGPTGEYNLTFTATDATNPGNADSTSLTINVRSKPSSGSNFFGCSAGQSGRPDPLFALMLLIAIGWVVARAKRTTTS